MPHSPFPSEEPTPPAGFGAHPRGSVPAWISGEVLALQAIAGGADHANGSARDPKVLPLQHGGVAPATFGAVPWPTLPGLDVNASLAGMLDEVDYGMLMLDDKGQVVYRNHAAGLQLDAEHPLQVGPQGVRSLRPQDQTKLLEALSSARRGLRRLLQLGEAEQRVSVAVVPLTAAHAGSPAATLLLLGKRRVCQQLSVLGFARLTGMTAAETRVLEALCAGVDPTDIAKRRAVKMSTVRTQINRIREKCGAASIREVVQQVAMLPPMVSALRGTPRPLRGAAGTH
jgi:DNA-binding NarL/FixJ family response regulator